MRTKLVSLAFTVIILAICWVHAQDAASGVKAHEKAAESASTAQVSENKPEESESQKQIGRGAGSMKKTDQADMKRVTGIGGVFFRAKDPAKLRAWYKTHLGIDVQTWGGAAFTGVPAIAKTAWFVGDGSNFAPSSSSFMINYRVADLHRLLRVLREEDCQVLDKVEESDYGIFGWVMDPEGNKVELWQPPEGQ
jgi:predicted enzyme related to lactoylglutathione lyase